MGGFADLSVRYPQFEAELLEMARIDQKSRKEAGSDPTNLTPDIDRNNLQRLKKIVEEIGWPTRSKVGQEGSQAAWLIAQHADHDPAFQEQALQLMKILPPSEVGLRNLAFLEDRVLLANGLNQKYGTQLTVLNGVIVPRPIEDEVHVDVRRRAIGLEPLADYLKNVSSL